MSYVIKGFLFHLRDGGQSNCLLKWQSEFWSKCSMLEKESTSHNRLEAVLRSKNNGEILLTALECFSVTELWPDEKWGCKLYSLKMYVLCIDPFV